MFDEDEDLGWFNHGTFFKIYVILLLVKLGRVIIFIFIFNEKILRWVIGV